MFGADLLTSVDRFGRIPSTGNRDPTRRSAHLCGAMQSLPFSKWQGTGNDFIVLDDRMGQIPADHRRLAVELCHRHFGIGSDGLILLQAPREAGTDYHMEFLNPDGSRSFCGNGSRCAFAFRSRLMQGRSPARFTAIDGVHQATWAEEEVEVTMRDCAGLETLGPDVELLQTGSPHLVIWHADPLSVDLIAAAREWRYGPRFNAEGVNVNYVRWQHGAVEMRTYERGVEAETLSCGTGVTAAALSAMARGLGNGGCTVRTAGGVLRVLAEKEGSGFVNVRLRGPVEEVYMGNIALRP
jgi:diaminopimelate epimerase